MGRVSIVRPFALAALLLASAAPARADGWSPLGFSFVSVETPHERRNDQNRPLDISLPSYGTAIYGLRLGFISAANRRMYGLSVSLANMRHYWSGDNHPIDFHSDGDVAGIQIGGFFNYASSSRYGVLQAAGLANILWSEGTAFQIAGLVNNAETMQGVQIGAINWVEDALSGLQIGAFNLADSMQGVQIGAVNWVDNDMSGLQIGIVNEIGGDSNGVQVGVLNEVDGNVKGLQIGIVNFTWKTMQGVQFGALNISGGDFFGVQIGLINGCGQAHPPALPLLRIYF